MADIGKELDRVADYLTLLGGCSTRFCAEIAMTEALVADIRGNAVFDEQVKDAYSLIAEGLIMLAYASGMPENPEFNKDYTGG